MSDPYIGISGFTSRDEVVSALAAFPDCGRKLMVGVLASSKSLCNQPLKQPLRYPRREDIAGIFVVDPRCLNLVHVYNDHEWVIDRVRVPLAVDMWRAMAAGGPLCHGVQVNAKRAKHTEIAAARKAHKIERVVLQVRPTMIATLRSHNEFTFNALGCLANVTDVLIDASLGKGRALDIDETRRSIDTIRHWSPDMRIGIAGGICAATIPGIGDLLREGVSIDAEGKLRDDADGGGNLVPAEARAYLAAVGKALQ